MARSVLISVLTVLVAMLTGCGGVHRYDSRLVQADSLMKSAPDSVLALVEALPASDLSTEGDRAYRDLLLTQARYKCYITATSDSDINRALTYYRHHKNDREKLTRAYIYKGAVMEELGHPDSAMFYYKTAEATADTKDYANLGYIKMRMGALYNDYYSFDGKDIVKYEEAIECYHHTSDTSSLLKCLNNLGCIYRETNSQKAEDLLKEASLLAHQLNDSNHIISNTHAFIVLYLYNQQYEKARLVVNELLQYKKFIDDYQILFMASNVYARLHMLDSAYYFFNLAEKCPYESNAQYYRMYYLSSLSEIELAYNDTLSSLKHQQESNLITNTLMANSEKVNILNNENKFDKSQLIKNQNSRLKLASRVKTTIVFFVLMIIVLFRYFYIRKHKYDQLIVELRQETIEQANDIENLQNHFKQMNTGDDDLSDFISSHIMMMRNMIEACYHSPANILASEIRQIVEFQAKNKNNWKKLYVFIDKEFNNIMKFTKQNYPQIKERDLLLLALTCMDFSCAQIAIIMGYSNASTIGGNRQRLARKLGLNGSLNDYILQFKKHK